jgi:hypothetical protein
MIRGTTPTHTFDIEIDTNIIKTAKVTYSQQDSVILEKKTEDCELCDHSISVCLTQEDTLAFDNRYPVYIQVRILTVDDVAMSCDPFAVPVGKCLDNEVLR